MKRILLTIILGIFLLSSASASMGFTTSDTVHYLNIQGEGSDGSPIGFKDIVDYFDANPIASDLQMPVSGDLAEGNSVGWNLSNGDINTPTLNNVLNTTGNYSINTSKIGTGGFEITWSGVSDPLFTNNFNGDIADSIKFWVRTSNASVILDRLTVYGYYSAGNPYAYPIVYTNNSNGWSFLVDTWTEVEIDIRKDYDSVGGRSYWGRISKIQLNFSSGVSGNKIYIDGLRLEIGNPNPTSPFPNYYIFPTAIYMTTSYFEDKGFVMTANALSSKGSTTGSPIYANAMYQFDVGSYTKGGTFYRNSMAEDASGNFIATGNYVYNILGITFTGGVKQAYSFYCGTNNCLVENTNFYNVADVQGYPTTTFKNVVVGESRYPIRMGYVPILDDFTFYRSSQYGYVNILERPIVEIKGLKPVGWTTSYQFLYSRNYNLNSNHTHNLTNLDLSESSFGRLSIAIYGANVPVGNVLRQNVKYTLDLKVIDENGISIENATVSMNDVNGNEVFSTITDENGTISEQTIIARYNSVTSNGVSTTSVPWNPRTEGTVLTPHTLTINKTNYETYNSIFNLTEKLDWTIALESRDWNYSQSLAWKILNLTDTTILKLSDDGNLAIAGLLYENTNTPPPNVIYKIANVLWLTQKGDLYLVKELMEMII